MSHGSFPSGLQKCRIAVRNRAATFLHKVSGGLYDLNMGIFKTRSAAEEFGKEDPFILEGLVKSYVIKDWDDRLLPD